MAVALATGDITIAGTGTVSHVNGNHILAFGHPMLGLGDVELPMASAEIITILPSQLNSFKLSNTGEVIGTISQDRLSAIYGEVGPKPTMMPISVKTPGRTLNFSTVRHDRLAPMIAAAGLSQAVLGSNENGLAEGFHITTTITYPGGRTLATDTIFAGPQGFSSGLSQFIRRLSASLSNPIAEVFPDALSFVVETLPRNPTANLDLIQVPATAFSLAMTCSSHSPSATTRRTRPRNHHHSRPLRLARETPRTPRHARRFPRTRHRPSRMATVSQIRSFDSYLDLMSDKRRDDGLYVVVAERAGAFIDQTQLTLDYPGSVERIAGARTKPVSKNATFSCRFGSSIFSPANSSKPLIAAHFKSANNPTGAGNYRRNRRPAFLGNAAIVRLFFIAQNPVRPRWRPANSPKLPSEFPAVPEFQIRSSVFVARAHSTLSPSTRPSRTSPLSTMPHAHHRQAPRSLPAFAPFVCLASLSLLTLLPSLFSAPLSRSLAIDFFRDVPSRNLKGLATRSDGRLVAGPVLTDLNGPTVADILWTLEASSGNRWLVGTGPEGKIFELTLDLEKNAFTSREITDLDDTHVFALKRLPDGALLAGTSPHGTLYLVRGDKITARVTLPADSIYDLQLSADAKTAYIATGNPGQIYALDLAKFSTAGLDAGKLTDSAKLAEKGFRLLGEIKDRNARRIALLCTNLVIGSAPKGNLYTLPLSGGEPLIVQENRDAEVATLLPQPNGDLYAAIVFSNQQAESRLNPPANRSLHCAHRNAARRDSTRHASRARSTSRAPMLPAPQPRPRLRPSLPFRNFPAAVPSSISPKTAYPKPSFRAAISPSTLSPVAPTHS